MRHDPHLLIEGALLASFAMRAHTCYIYVRGEFIRERERLQAAVDEAYAAKLIGKDNIHGWDFDFIVHHGAGAYICGEETALLESLEGKKGMPRLKPPFPANVGLYGAPTTVNNVEIHRRACRTSCAAARPGSPRSASPTTPAPSCSRSPATSRSPAWSRRRWASRCASCIERHAGGVRGGWDNLLAVIPGGSSMPCLPADHLPGPDARLRHARPSSSRAWARRPSSSWTSRPTSSPPSARIAYFYKHESCGQCTPCREGCGWMWRVLQRMERGRSGEARDRPAAST